MYNNYVIGVDENGQPYIAHAFGDTPGYGRQKKNHKYLVRVRDGLKWRYFYSLKEYEAYMRELRGTNQKKYNKAKKTVQENPNAHKVFSKKEFDTIDWISDRKMEQAASRLQEAKRQYNAARSSGNVTPDEIQRYKKELEKLQREYELMKDIM